MAQRRRQTYQGRRERPTKRQKVGNTGENGDAVSVRSKVPKRKYALIFGYKGTAYNGLQKQANEGDNVKTVEGVLMDALKAISAITEAQLADPYRLHWARVGRTDRGVHAACQVICAKISLGPLTEEDKEYVERAKEKAQTGASRDKEATSNAEPLDAIKEDAPKGEAEDVNEESHKRLGKATLVDEKNDTEVDDVNEESQPVPLQRIRELRFLANLKAQLPDDIEVYDVVRVWGTWDARMRAGRRVYEYCLPVRVLQKVKLRDNHDAFVRFCQMRGVEDPESKFCPYKLKQKLFDALHRKDASTIEMMKTDLSEEGLGAICNRWRTEFSTIRQNFFRMDTEERINLWKEFKCELDVDIEKPPYPPPALSPFYNIPHVTDGDAEPFTDDNLAEFQSILDMYKGSHHWFNFTSKISAHDNTGQRFIEDIKAYRIGRRIDGEDLIVVRIIGQSFLLNQIRKMIAVALEVYMGLAASGTIHDLLTPPLEPKRHVHLAPGEGLMLERVFFDIHDRLQRISADKLVLHHPFELANPHGQVMETFLTTGTYPNIQDDCINEHGVFKRNTDDKPKTNLLLDDPEEKKILPASSTLAFDEKDQLPSWAKILLYKHQQLHPWIVNLFKNTHTWRRYLRDVLWHPFALENYPTPLERCITLKEESEEEKFNDASTTEVNE